MGVYGGLQDSMSCPMAMGVLVQWDMKVLLPAPVCPMMAIKVSVGLGTIPSRRPVFVILPTGAVGVSHGGVYLSRKEARPQA